MKIISGLILIVVFLMALSLNPCLAQDAPLSYETNDVMPVYRDKNKREALPAQPESIEQKNVQALAELAHEEREHEIPRIRETAILELPHTLPAETLAQARFIEQSFTTDLGFGMRQEIVYYNHQYHHMRIFHPDGSSVIYLPKGDVRWVAKESTPAAVSRDKEAGIRVYRGALGEGFYQELQYRGNDLIGIRITFPGGNYSLSGL